MCWATGERSCLPVVELLLAKLPDPSLIKQLKNPP